MADHADDGGNNDGVFVYMGGEIPQHLRETITHARVHKSVKIITREAFSGCRNLVSIEMHDGVEIIEHHAFWGCTSLRRIKLPGVRIIEGAAFEGGAFSHCTALEDVEFGDKLETIAGSGFNGCTALTTIKIPNIRYLGSYTFQKCHQLTDVELSEDLETMCGWVFCKCRRLRRIAMPLKPNLLCNGVFLECDSLSQVDLVGGIHKTVSSLLLDSWKNEMNDEIGRINRDLPNSPADKTAANKARTIRQWMGRVLERIEHYKSEHYTLLKEDMTQLELALWKVNLPNVDAAASRHEARVTCGANIIIPHVLSFLNDDEVFPTVRDVPL
jgi:hypothetical protein